MSKRRKKRNSQNRRPQTKGQELQHANRSRRHKPSPASRSEIYRRFRNHLGETFQLVDVHPIRYPYVKVKLSVLVSGKPDDWMAEAHLIMLGLIREGVATRLSIAQFLGLDAEDFLLDELTKLREEGLIARRTDDTLYLTAKGEGFVEANDYIPETRIETFSFLIDGLREERILPDGELKSAEENELFRPTFTRPTNPYLQQNWEALADCFQQQYEDQQLVDLADAKRSIEFSKVFYREVLALPFVPAEDENESPRLILVTAAGKELKAEGEAMEKRWQENPQLFTEPEEAEDVREERPAFEAVAQEVEHLQKQVGPEAYQQLSTFDMKEQLIWALKNAKQALLIESPWIKYVTREYLPAIRKLVQKKVQVCILYGIGLRQKRENGDHPKILSQLEDMAQRNPGHMKLVFLPDHFRQEGIPHEGTHRKRLLCDQSWYILGSYNWLSYSWKEDQEYPLEQGTQFRVGAAEQWEEVFREYHLEREWLWI